MAGEIEAQDEAAVEQVPADPWATAFAALEQEDEKAAEEDVPGGQDAPAAGAEGADAGADADADDGEDAAEPGLDAGGPGDLDGESAAPVGGAGGDDHGSALEAQELEQIRSSVVENVTERAVRDVAQAYIKKGARHTNGKLGATIDDKDICKRDEDGVPHFYNPDTGREFSGDNPRRQAQEWCDDYNRSLAAAFNETCEGYSKKLLAEAEPQLKAMEFEPVFDKLDPVRQIMLDQLLEGHEVYDSDGDLVGYDCDLNAMLGKVNNQVRYIQQHYQQSHQTQSQAEPPKPAGPALDMRSTQGGSSSRPEFKSIAEALEYQQDQELAKLRAKSNR